MKGPNHKLSCDDGTAWRYSGSGYNRVRVCSCGAEDHAPDTLPGRTYHVTDDDIRRMERIRERTPRPTLIERPDPPPPREPFQG